MSKYPFHYYRRRQEYMEFIYDGERKLGLSCILIQLNLKEDLLTYKSGKRGFQVWAQNSLLFVGQNLPQVFLKILAYFKQLRIYSVIIFVLMWIFFILLKPRECVPERRVNRLLIRVLLYIYTNVCILFRNLDSSVARFLCQKSFFL